MTRGERCAVWGCWAKICPADAKRPSDEATNVGDHDRARNRGTFRQIKALWICDSKDIL